MTSTESARVGIMWAGNSADPPPVPAQTRFSAIFEAFEARGVRAEPVVYADEVAEAVLARLHALDGVLVWVNPLVSEARNRAILDGLLREVAAAGVFVSAHPDVILKLGTKEVLYTTRDLPWGTDTHVYRSLPELEKGLLQVLRQGPRVLKQYRGNDGNGVWKVAVVAEALPAGQSQLTMQHALRGARVEPMTYAALLERCAPYLAAAGRIIDQPYQRRVGEGMVRCYMTHDRVVGFGHQRVTALTDPLAPGEAVPDPEPRVYYGADKPEFQPLKVALEGGWLAQMQQVLGIEREDLPVIWDADFLLGEPDAAGEHSYVLCEINVSSVFPIPDEAVAPLVDAALMRILGGVRRVQHRSSSG